MPQNLIVYPQNGNFRLFGEPDRQVLAENASAASVIEEGLKLLAESGGGELVLGAGTYRIERSIEVPSLVHLRGGGRATRLVVTKGAGTGIILKGVRGSRVSDLSLTAEEVHGLIAGVDAVGIDIDFAADCQVVDVFCKDFAEYGIWLRNGSALSEIRGCKVYNSGKAGICAKDLQHKGHLGNFVPNMITNCVVAGGQEGFLVQHAIVLNLVGCQVYQTAGHGFHLTFKSNSVSLVGCRTFQVGGHAYISEGGANEVCLSGNVFCWHRGDGIVLDKVSWGTISGNEIIDNGVRTKDGSYRDGIVLRNQCRGLQISGNAIFNWADQCPMRHGITEDETCYDNNLSGNNINYHTEGGIVSQGKETKVVDNVVTDTVYMNDPNNPFPDFDTVKLDKFIKGYF